MNEQIRQAVRSALEVRGMSTEELGRTIGESGGNVRNMLSGKRAHLPRIWAATLDALGLELQVVKKRRRKTAP